MSSCCRVGISARGPEASAEAECCGAGIRGGTAAAAGGVGVGRECKEELGGVGTASPGPGAEVKRKGRGEWWMMGELSPSRESEGFFSRERCNSKAFDYIVMSV